MRIQTKKSFVFIITLHTLWENACGRLKTYLKLRTHESFAGHYGEFNELLAPKPLLNEIKYMCVYVQFFFWLTNKKSFFFILLFCSFALRVQESDPTELKPVFSDGGISYIYIQHNNIYIVALTRKNSNVTAILVFLERLVEVSYKN